MNTGNPTVPHIKAFKIGGEELDVDYFLKHDFDDIREASEVLPASMAWLGWQRAYFQEQLYMTEVALKSCRAKLYQHYKANGLESDGYAGKATEAAVEHAINSHPEMADIFAKIGKYTRIISNLMSYIFAFERKIELVRSGEATHRKVVDNEPLTDEELQERAQNQGRKY
jgi:hypothetical protein